MNTTLVTADVDLDPAVRTFLESLAAAYGSMEPEALMEEYFTEDVVYADHRPMVSGTVRGREAMAGYLRTTFEMLPDFRISVHVLAADGTRYLACDTYIGHAAEGGGAAEMQWWVVDELRDGKLAREDIYETEEQARAEFEARAT